MLEAGANVNVANKRGETPLHFAVAEGKLETIPMLLTAGANVDAIFNPTDSIGWTPLLWAVGHRNIELIEMLLAAGANVNTGLTEGTLLTYAIQKGAIEHRIEVIEVLLAAGANVNATSNQDGTPLFWAVEKGLGMESIEILLEAGANVNGCTPLHGKHL